MRAIGYDSIASEYESVRHPHCDVQGFIESNVRPQQYQVHIDLACGTCSETRFLMDYGISLIGIDNSREMLTIAKAKVHGVFIQWDLETPLPFPSGSIDSATMVSALHHISNKIEFLREVRRILKPRAPFAIVTNSQEQILTRGYYAFFAGALELNLRRFPPNDVLESLLKHAGFTQVMLSELRREPIPVDKVFVDRLASGALDSAMRLIPKDVFDSGLVALRTALSNNIGDGLRRSHNRLGVLAT